MRSRATLAAVVGVVLAGSAVHAGGTAAPDRPAGNPETVMIEFRAKAGAEGALGEAIADHWRTGRRLGLILEKPHVTVRGEDDQGRTFFVDIFAWRDAHSPDDPPPAIRAIWQRMSALVDPNHGRRGLQITAVSLVAAAEPGPCLPATVP